MAHEIFGERFLGRREPAWHGLGRVFNEPLTASEAMEQARVDFEIKKVPSFIEVDGAMIQTGDFAVVREPVPDDPMHRVLANVGKLWEPIQAKELGAMLDPLSKEFPVETTGALGYGERIFLTLDAGEMNIAGEHHRLFYLVTDERTGKGALSIAFTPVRVVCMNTLVTGLGAAKISVRLTHTNSTKEDAQFYTKLFGQMAGARDETVQALNSLANKKLSTEQASAIINAAYPEKAKPRRLRFAAGMKAEDLPENIIAAQDRWERANASHLDSIQQKRDAVWELYEVFNQEHSDYAGTAWAAYQAVVETEDYRRNLAAPEKQSLASTLYGVRAEAKQRAFATALKI